MRDPSMGVWRQKIDQAPSYEALFHIRRQFHEFVMNEHPATTGMPHIEWVNRVHDWIIGKSVRLSEEILASRGKGRPPVRYAFLLFGSGGRKEQTLWSDQDNGLVFDFTDNDGEEEYFRHLGCEIVKGLETAGYPPCEGKVTADQERWCGSVQSFGSMMQTWFAEADWESVRYLLIVSDMRCVSGSEELVVEIRKRFFQLLSAKPSIVGNMLRNTLKHKILLGVFGHLIKEQYGEDAGGLDVKYGAYIPMVNAIRLLAIRSGLAETSTLSRIEALYRRGQISPSQAEEWKSAFCFFMELRSRAEYKIVDGIYTSKGIIKARDLDREERLTFKRMLRIGKNLQRFIHKEAGKQERT